MLVSIQKPNNIEDIDHQIHKYVQRDMLYLGVYTKGGCYFGRAVLGPLRYSV